MLHDYQNFKDCLLLTLLEVAGGMPWDNRQLFK